MKEVWKAISGYEGCYEASTLGRIKSLARSQRTFQGNLRYRKDHILLPKIVKGRAYVSLYRDGRGKTFRMEHLVWETFRGPIPEGQRITRRTENPHDNRLHNLILMKTKVTA